MAKVKELLGLQDKWAPEQPTPLLVSPKQRMGLEYEWENTGKFPFHPPAIDDGQIISRTHNLFEVIKDGSLRKDGKEFTFKDGYSGSLIVKSVDIMDEVQRMFGFEGTYRTSLHVHLDMQDARFPEDIENLGAVYCICEPLIYKFIGNQRFACNYCTPWFSHPQSFEEFFSLIRKTQTLPMPAKKNYLVQGKEHKYTGLNFFSLGDFGTVEWRQAPVTMQRDKILLWLNIIMLIKDYAMKEVQSPTQLVDKACRYGPDWFFSAVFKDYTRSITKYSRSIPQDFNEGISTLYSFIAAN